MPFTLSHTAASLPFLNRSKAVGWKIALVVGTMAPDLMFPIPFFGERHHTHSIKGLFALDVPFAFVIAAIWIFWISKRISRLPGLEALGRHDSSAFSIPMTILGAFIGGCTHLAWDMFTHQGSPLLAHEIFYRPLVQKFGATVTLQNLSWQVNSLIGCGFLIWWGRRRLHGQGAGLRKHLLSRSWLRIYAGFLLPYTLVLGRVVQTQPAKMSDVVDDMAYLVDLVRVGMLVSIVFALAVAWWETRSMPENVT